MVFSSIIGRLRYSSKASIISYSILFIFLASLIMLTLYYISGNPPDSPSTKMTSHFLLSVKPKLLDNTTPVEISVSFFQPMVSNKAIAQVVVIDPEGTKYWKEVIDNFSKFTFPNDFGNLNSAISEMEIILFFSCLIQIIRSKLPCSFS